MMMEILLYIAVSILAFFFLAFLIVLFSWRFIVKKIYSKITTILLSDSYEENLLEVIPGVRHIGLQNFIENSLRAETGDVVNRPLGSSKNTWPHLDSLTFIPVQTSPFPISSDEDVDVAVTIGPKAKRPMHLDIPLIISGMAYGIGLNEGMRLALAKAANRIGTALNSGEGGILREELDTAGKYILQFSKAPWGKEKSTVERADMIEIKLGQGAKGGIGTKIEPEYLTGRARDIMGLSENEDAIIHEHFFRRQSLRDLKNLVHTLREETDGVPIGVKIGAGGKIESDIDHLLEIGVDVIAIDGGQAATHAGAPVLADDFGIPTLHAIVRAVNHLEKRKVKDDISLIVSGGLITPGQFLKMLALGADAIYLGTAILFATAHGQTNQALPFEPPTQVVWYSGKYRDQFDSNTGAEAAENFLHASVEEMKMALRAMGKCSLKELTKKDLVSYDEHISKWVKVPYSFQPYKR